MRCLALTLVIAVCAGARALHAPPSSAQQPPTPQQLTAAFP